MTTFNLSTIRVALGTALAGLGFNVRDYDPEEIPTTDAVVVGLPVEITYQISMSRGDAELELPVTFYFGTTAERAAQRKLDAALSWVSGGAVYDFQTAINATSSPPWRAATVKTAQDVRRIPTANGHLLAVDVTVSVRS